MCSLDSYQLDDYSKAISDRFDPVKKQQRRKEIFPKDCEKALGMGARFANCREKDNPLAI